MPENYSGWQYLQNITFTKDEVVDRFDYTVDQARAMASFFIDWHAIKYIEEFSLCRGPMGARFQIILLTIRQLSKGMKR